MASKIKARITLVGPMSYTVGRYNFKKDKPQVTEDKELVSYLQGDPRFKIEILEQEAPAKAKAAPASQAKAPVAKDVADEAPPQDEEDADFGADADEAAPEKSAAPEKVEKPGLLKKAANAVKSIGKSAPPSKSAQKDKKEMAHEAD